MADNHDPTDEAGAALQRVTWVESWLYIMAYFLQLNLGTYAIIPGPIYVSLGIALLLWVSK